MAEQARNDNNCPANLYELQGYDIFITYSTTSFTGEARFSYRSGNSPDGQREFSGDEIVVEDTRLGRLVSVQLESNAADQGFEYVALLLPALQLAGAESLEIQTLVLRSKTAGFFSTGEPLQLQWYDTICVYGTAKKVVF